MLGAALATLLVLPVTGADPSVERWIVVAADAVTIEQQAGVDRTRRPARVRADALRVDAGDVLECPAGAAGVAGITGLLAAAEAVGAAAWCVDTAAEYARVREQFGRPIGQFQAVKHRCADMLCTLEAARAATWAAAGAVDRADQPCRWTWPWPLRSAPRPRTAAPRTASRCWAASASPGSTTPTCT